MRHSAPWNIRGLSGAADWDIPVGITNFVPIAGVRSSISSTQRESGMGVVAVVWGWIGRVASGTKAGGMEGLGRTWVPSSVWIVLAAIHARPRVLAVPVKTGLTSRDVRGLHIHERGGVGRLVPAV